MENGEKQPVLAGGLIAPRLLWRVQHGLCIACGGPATESRLPLCAGCRQLPRNRRLLDVRSAGQLGWGKRAIL